MTHAIRYPEMQKSQLVLYDIAAFYLPLYGQSWSAFFPHYAILGIVEGLIYQVELALEQTRTPSVLDVNPWVKKEQEIEAFLAEHQLDLPVILPYLNEVGQYFQLVQQTQTLNTFTPAGVIRTLERRPADIRLLHAILTQLLGEPYDESLFALLWPLEVLLDLKANLTEYADDLKTGHYNSYQMLVKLYGSQAPSYVKAEQARYQTLLHERLVLASPEQQTLIQNFMQQHEAAYPSVPIPPPIFFPKEVAL
jgi:hypothetical protein